jgi:RNA polymerase sigma factor (sigma-70 family)
MMGTVLPYPATATADAMTLERASPEPARSAPGRIATHEATAKRWAGLMLQAQDGDRVAYHTLLQEIVPYLRRIARRHLGPGEDVEDAVQDILLTVHHIRHTYERGRPFKPWLATIASRRCIDQLRQRSRRLRHEVESADDLHDMPSATDDPEDHASRTHAAHRVRGAVAMLPARQREAVELLRLDELTLNEAAAASDQSIGSLKVACHRALKSLRRAFGDRSSSHE